MPPPTETTRDVTTDAPPEGGAGAAREGSEPMVCPFCGSAMGAGTRCGSCGAYTDPLSRQATQNEMGPWFIRDEAHPFRPGCRLETIERWVRTGRITAGTVLRGPTTHQNWTRATRVPGVAHLLGVCHACQGAASADEVICGSCGASLTAERDRQHLGLSPVRAIPGRGDPGAIARALLGSGATPPRAGTVEGKPAGPVGPFAQTHQSGTRSEDHGGHASSGEPARAGSRPTRLERRLRGANQRAGVAAFFAVLFAVLFALSMFMSWGGGSVEPGTGSAVMPTTADDLGD